MSERPPVAWVLEPDVFPARYWMRFVVQGTGSSCGTMTGGLIRHGRISPISQLYFTAVCKTRLAFVKRSPGSRAPTATLLPSNVDLGIRASPWLLHQQWKILSANSLVANPDAALRSIGAVDEVFVRPNSPLKPFAGRVLSRARITLEALDYGFYFDDSEIDVVLTPVRRSAANGGLSSWPQLSSPAALSS